MELQLAPEDKKPFYLSIGVVGLGLLSVILFFIPGARLFFYIFTVMTLALGFYMAYTLSQQSQNEQPRRKSGSKRKGR